MKKLLLSLCILAAMLGMRSAAQESSYDQPWRPQYHFTPPRNFMNDPNGTVFYKGEYHPLLPSYLQYDGERRLSARIYPQRGSEEIELYTKGGGGKIVSLNLWQLDSVWK